MEQTSFPSPSCRSVYIVPVVRVLPLRLSTSILSNTERIDGKDDPEIDW